jgi:hypothetical protein
MCYQKIFPGLLLLMFTIPASAMFCPSGFNQINMGDTIAQVQQACGMPASTTTSDSSEDKPQEWTYYVKEQPTDQTTLRMTVAFTTGAVTNMSVNGIGVSNTQICGGNTVQTGDSQKSVKNACGEPAFIAQSNLPSAAGDVVKVSQLTYNTSSQPVVLEFKDGKLSSRK